VAGKQQLTLQVPGPLSGPKFLFVAVIWLLIVFGFAAVTTGVNRQWTTGNTNNRSDQCEALNYKGDTMAGTVLEPQNAWSNIFYLLAGMLVLFCTRRPMGYVVGIQLCVLAFLSGMYHGTLAEDWQFQDVASIYFILWAILLYGIQAALLGDRLFTWIDSDGGRKVAEWILAVVLAGVTTALGYYMANNRTKVYLFSSTTATFTFVTAIIVVISYRMGQVYFNWFSAINIFRLWTPPNASFGDYFKVWKIFSPDVQDTEWHLRNYLWGFAIFGGIGVFCRLRDGDGNAFCSPHSVLQAHAVWHTFSAVALMLAYDFFAWKKDWDYPVFMRNWPQPPTSGQGAVLSGYKLEPVYVTAIVSGALGAILVVPTLTGALVEPRKDDLSSAPTVTGLGIAGFFLLLALVLCLLRVAGVIGKPTGAET
jgi:Ceramidase